MDSYQSRAEGRWSSRHFRRSIETLYLHEVELLQAIGSVIGVAIENARLFEQTRKQAAELEQSNRGEG